MAGSFDIALSPKRRLQLRKAFVLGNDRVFLINCFYLEGIPCLRGFSPGSWLKFLAGGSEPELLAAFEAGGAYELALDKNGAIVIPARLLKFAGIERRVALDESGSGFDGFFLWEPSRYDAAKQWAWAYIMPRAQKCLAF